MRNPTMQFGPFTILYIREWDNDEYNIEVVDATLLGVSVEESPVVDLLQDIVSYCYDLTADELKPLADTLSPILVDLTKGKYDLARITPLIRAKREHGIVDAAQYVERMRQNVETALDRAKADLVRAEKVHADTLAHAAADIEPIAIYEVKSAIVHHLQTRIY